MPSGWSSLASNQLLLSAPADTVRSVPLTTGIQAQEMVSCAPMSP